MSYMYRKPKSEEEQYLDGTYVATVKKLSQDKQEQFFEELEKDNEDSNN